MNSIQLLNHFDRISEAPEAIPRLRRFILDLAVRGKLAEQSVTDEPAPELLQRIQSERTRLVKRGKVRNHRALDGSDGELDLFSLPESWVWCRLSDVGAIVGGGTPPSGDADNFISPGQGTPWLTPADLGKQKSLLVSSGARDLTPKGLRDSSATVIPRGSVVFTSRAPIGYTAIAANEISTSQGFKSVVPYILECNLYIATYFRAFAGWINENATGTTFREVSGKTVANLPFPLPPLAEQQRIVAKVDELMALCDRLEVANAERERRRDRLTAASPNRLHQPSAEAPTFHEHARFQLDRLPRLVTRHRHVEQLRQTILNLSVRGQLVSQNPNDEPAVRLLNKIAAERQKRMNAGTTRRKTAELPATADDLAFELKPGWQPARISQIILELQTGPFGSSLHQSDYRRGGIPVINPASIRNGRLVPIDKMAVGPETLERLAGFKLNAGDIVLARRGEMGRCAIVSSREHGWLCGTGTLILRLPECLFAPFFVLLLGAPFVREYLGGSAVGATMQNLNQSILLALVIGVPPFAEQQRIVAKVDELMSVCDQLEIQLTVARTEGGRLLEAILFEALGSVA